MRAWLGQTMRSSHYVLLVGKVAYHVARRICVCRRRTPYVNLHGRLGEPVEFEALPDYSGGRPLLRLGLLPCPDWFGLPDGHRTFLEPERISRKLWDSRSFFDYDTIWERSNPGLDWSVTLLALVEG